MGEQTENGGILKAEAAIAWESDRMNQLSLELQPSEPEYRRIKLTQGQFAIVDAADYDYLNQWNWQARWSPRYRSFVAARTESQTSLYMSRLIMGITDRIVIVDHENHNTLDNRRLNLRLVNRYQSQWNKKRSRNNTSGFKGVSFNKASGKWFARIGFNNKTFHLGAFQTATMAHEAYRTAALRLHGEFACFG